MTTSTRSTTMPNPADVTLLPSASYAEAHAVLSGTAERLRTTGATANIDRLAADLRAARSAHAICRDRLGAIRREIDVEVAAAQADGVTT